jgi:allantoin racemase
MAAELARTRILVVNPNTTDAMTETMARQARRAAAADTEIIAVTAPFGPPAIEGWADAQVAGGAVLDVLASHAGTFDGAIIAAYGEPGLRAAREVCPVPVVGIAEASMLLACTVAERFAIVTLSKRLRPMVHAVVHGHGLSSRCTSVRAVGSSVGGAVSDATTTGRELVAAAQDALDREGVGAIILAGGVMGDFQAPVQRALGVPVLEGVACGVRLVRSRVGLTSPESGERR